jgi:hypothetical protein
MEASLIRIRTNSEGSVFGPWRLKNLQIRIHNTFQKALLQMALLSKSPIREGEESADVKLKMEKQVRKKY